MEGHADSESLPHTMQMWKPRALGATFCDGQLWNFISPFTFYL